MCSVQELQRVDRELFSELMETPINPAFFHMSTPFVDVTTRCSTSKSTERDCGSCEGTSAETRTSYVQFFKIICLKLDTSWRSHLLFELETLWRTEHNTSSTKHGTRVTAASEKPCDPHFGVKLHFIQEHGECLNCRKNESDGDVIDFSLSSDWYAEQCEIYLLNIKFTKEK